MSDREMPEIIVPGSDRLEADIQEFYETEGVAGCSVLLAKEMLSEIYRLRKLLVAVRDHYAEHYKNWDHPCAPGHMHNVVGRWDADGSLCEWCATWNKVKAACEGKLSESDPVMKDSGRTA